MDVPHRSRSMSNGSRALGRRRAIRHLRANLPSGVATRPHAAWRRRVVERPRRGTLLSPHHPPSITASPAPISGRPPRSTPPNRPTFTWVGATEP